MISAALTRARRLAPHLFVGVRYRTAPILDVVAECDACGLAFTAGQLAALPPVSSSIAARRCRCGGIVVVGS